jgi:hypothetical protein
MSEGDFMRAFEDGTLPPRDFHHGDHLRAAWLLLDSLPLDEALSATRRGLQTLALRAGVPGHYHETITRGWMVLLSARRKMQSQHSLEACLADFPEGKNPLHMYWSEELLRSKGARAGWVPPDLSSLPEPQETATRYTKEG